jgi:hypothetical protein
MKLSEHLDLSEVTRSDMAKRKGLSNMPTPEHIENFKILAENIFEPIRKHFGVPIFVSSGYRSKALNTAIGGSLTSQHCLGQALDLDMDGTKNGVTNKMVFDFIKDNLEYDQLILELKTHLIGFTFLTIQKVSNVNKLYEQLKVVEKLFISLIHNGRFKKHIIK